MNTNMLIIRLSGNSNSIAAYGNNLLTVTQNLLIFDFNYYS